MRATELNVKAMLPEERALLEKQLQECRISEIEEKVSALEKRIKYEDEKHRQEIEDLRKQQHAQSEKVDYIKGRKESNEFVGLRDLGRIHNPEILNLMRIVLQYAGILQRGGRVIPYERYIRGKDPIVLRDTYPLQNGEERVHYKFHSTRTWNIVDNALKRNGIYETFNTCKTKDDIDRFIKHELKQHVRVKKV